MKRIGNVATHHAIAMIVSRSAARFAVVRTSPAAQSSRHIHGASGFAARKRSEGSTARAWKRTHQIAPMPAPAHAIAIDAASAARSQLPSPARVTATIAARSAAMDSGVPRNLMKPRTNRSGFVFTLVQRGEAIEKVREGLRDAFGILDLHAAEPQAGHREAHRYSMIVVSLDGRLMHRRRRNLKSVVVLDDRRAQ